MLRGPQSGLWGSDAIGGVINIITRSGNGPAQFTGAVEGGSFRTFNQAGTLSGSADSLHYSASVDHYHAGAVPVSPLELLQPGEARNDDYDDNLSFSTKLGLDVTPGFDLGLVARYADIHLHTTGEDYSDLPPYLGFPAAQPTTAATSEYFARLFAHGSAFDGVLEQTLGFSYTHDRTSTVEPATPAALNSGERREADWQGNIRIMSSETLVLGAEYERDEITQPLEASVHIGSGYAELQSQLGEHWFSALNLRYDDNSRFGSKVTYRFAPTWLLGSTDTKLKASIGSGFKAPTLSELYQNFPPFFFANPDLKPETSTGWDAGFEQGLGPALRFGVTWYRNSIRDLITTDVTGTTYANVGRATTEGIESFLSWQALSVLTLRLDYTYTEATDDVLNEELLRRPKHKGNLDAQWQASEAWQFNLDVLAVSGWVDGNRDFSIPRLEAPGYTTVNLATSYAFTPRFALYGRIDNLLDRHYENPVGFLQPRLGVFAGVKFKL